MKKHLITPLVLMAMAVTANADNGRNVQIDGIKYHISNHSATVIKYTGSKYSGDIVIPETIQCDGENIVVRTIGEEAFYECDGITSVTLPESIDSIGICAFWGCTGLTDIKIPDNTKYVGYTAFTNCTGFPVKGGIRYADKFLIEAVDKGRTAYQVQEGTRWIGINAMSYLQHAESITLPSSLEVIGNFAFSGCERLKNIRVPDSVSVIDISAFSSCISLENIDIPDNLKKIGDVAFRLCPCEDEMAIRLKDKGLYYSYVLKGGNN